MLSLTSHEICLLLTTILLPVLSIPLLYILPKKMNPGWMVGTIGLLQIGLSVYTLIATYQGTTFHQAWSWFMLPNGLSVQIGIYVDLVSALLLLMVSLIGWMVTLYAIAYLPSYANTRRYFSLYSLSLTAMLWILVADNLWGIFVGWELLGVTSCLLIGFWYQVPASMQASTYTWGINKIGSICFLIGLLLVVSELGNCNISTLAHLDASWASSSGNQLTLAGYCLLVAACTKSAQFPFFSWLPQAMAAPTPVSALLHTATVLSAGAYLLVRTQPILSPEIHTLLIVIGYLTACMGACAAVAQTHIKRMLAYSTLSHLGYVVAAIGLGNAHTGMLYLFMHAFAKACLFLGAGVTAHFLRSQGILEKEAYTISHMGGLWRQLPLVAASYLVASWGLGIIPGSISFTAKESIFAQSWLWASCTPGNYLYYTIPLLALVSTALTIFYMGRAFVRIFLGKPSWENLSVLPSPTSFQRSWLLQGSVVMCVICILLGAYFLSRYLPPTAINNSMATTTTYITYGLLLLVALWIIYYPTGPAVMSHRLFLHGWYLDACTTFLAKQLLACSQLAAQGEKWLIDGFINRLTIIYIMMANAVHWLDSQLIEGIGHGIAAMSQRGSKLYLHLQSGRTQLYILWTCIGMGVLVAVWMVLA